MFILFVLYIYLFIGAHAHSCCPTCACAKSCRAPDITLEVTQYGIMANCFNATCACVQDELDTCTYGNTWAGEELFPWQDNRWHECLRITSTSPLRVNGLLRWWENKCMGHVIVDIEIDLLPTQRDIYMSFDAISYYEHVDIYNVFRIRAKTGCQQDEHPLAGVGQLYFEVAMDPPTQGVHVEVVRCIVQATEGYDKDAPVLTEYNVSGTKSPIEDGERFTYTVFWDEETNSPFQRLLCTYALFNGTRTIDSSSNARTYMVANPDETGVLYD